MGKQTMGMPCQAMKHRSDNKMYRLQVKSNPWHTLVKVFLDGKRPLSLSVNIFGVFLFGLRAVPYIAIKIHL